MTAVPIGRMTFEIVVAKPHGNSTIRTVNLDENSAYYVSGDLRKHLIDALRDGHGDFDFNPGATITIRRLR